MTHFHPRRVKPVLLTLAGFLTLVTTTSAAAADPAPASVEADMLTMDQDADGRVTPAEHAEGARRLFARMDGDRNGRVTVAEMEAFGKAHPEASDRKAERTARHKLAAVDGDGDGMVTAAEHVTASERMFEAMDTDRNGQLDRVELATGHAKMLLKKP